MPELPEVETIRRGLSKAIVGKKITGIKVLNKKSFQGRIKDAVGKTILSVERRAKLLIMGLGRNNPELFLVIHLKMSGQLLFRIKNYELRIKNKKNKLHNFITKLPNQYTRVVLEFDDKSKLFFNDIRKFGWIKQISKFPNYPIENVKRIAGMKLGIEPLSQEFTVEYLKNVFSKTSRAVKLVLMDQEKIAGIGNIYANEALFLANIKPAKPANKLKKMEIKKLREAIIKILKKAIEYKGTSATNYIQPSGQLGEYQKYFLVYQRGGERCRGCKSLIKKVKLGGRSTFYCQECQK